MSNVEDVVYAKHCKILVNKEEALLSAQLDAFFPNEPKTFRFRFDPLQSTLAFFAVNVKATGFCVLLINTMHGILLIIVSRRLTPNLYAGVLGAKDKNFSPSSRRDL